ncbi:glycosyltransferase involved in cell wall biosynthesis [Salinibacter ruber]|nr:glycosyltransferase involved in cell wall biosynthesis [Salinibacter ruber]
MYLTAITPLLVTYNEEANLARTLDHLTWAEQVVVVDSYSEDSTIQIAKEYENVDLIFREFDDHTSQWNYGLDQVETEWVLSLDADYQVPPDFVDEVEGLNPSSAVAGYRATFTYCVFGRSLRSNLYPPRIVLFRSERARYEQDGHTQRLTVDGTVEELDTVLQHDDRKSLARWFDNQRQYARLEAQKLRAADELDLPDRLRKTDVLGPLLVPLYCLFRKGLILDGWSGWYYTLQRTYAELVIALTHLDAHLRDAGDGDGDGTEGTP